MPDDLIKHAEFVCWVEIGNEADAFDPELVNDTGLSGRLAFGRHGWLWRSLRRHGARRVGRGVEDSATATQSSVIRAIRYDAKAMTWQDEAEHLLLTLVTGERALVRGGRDGIRFTVRGEGGGRSLHLEIEGREVQVARIEWHTHPRVTGPSDGDLEALAILGQEQSQIDELGGDRDGTRITPKHGPPT